MSEQYSNEMPSQAGRNFPQRVIREVTNKTVRQLESKDKQNEERQKCRDTLVNSRVKAREK